MTKTLFVILYKHRVLYAPEPATCGHRHHGAVDGKRDGADPTLGRPPRGQPLTLPQKQTQGRRIHFHILPWLTPSPTSRCPPAQGDYPITSLPVGIKGWSMKCEQGFSSHLPRGPGRLCVTDNGGS